MNDYEAQRAATIAQNKALIASLGLGALESKSPRIKRGDPTDNDDYEDNDGEPSERPAKKARRALKAKPIIEPTRRSTRILNIPTEEHTSLPDDFSDASLERRSRQGIDRPTIRQLPRPDIPEIDDTELAKETTYDAELPTRDPGYGGYGRLKFQDTPHFTPNLTPGEMMRLGSFGGTYWRSMRSRVIREDLADDEYTEFPKDWYEGLDASLYLSSQEYDPDINQYGVKASQSIEEWEKAGWIMPIDPRGWMQWYCRFYLGRRCYDDDRQIKRYLSAVGPRGRFKTGLVKKVVQAGGIAAWDDKEVAPILRQTLQHWAVRLTKEDLQDYLGIEA